MWLSLSSGVPLQAQCGRVGSLHGPFQAQIGNFDQICSHRHAAKKNVGMRVVGVYAMYVLSVSLKFNTWGVGCGGT